MKEIREKIDAIDDQIIKLYQERMALIKEVALHKASLKTGITDITDTAREKAILERILKDISPEIRGYAEQFYDAVFQTSKAYQRGFM